MPKLIDLMGRRFFRLTVVGRAENRNGAARWICNCDCGGSVTVLSRELITSGTKSCGCWHRENQKLRANSVHGHAPKSGESAEYIAWRNMRLRCTKPGANFANYAGRGIRVCERWRSFENFLADMGGRPSPRHSLDRIDNNGNYEPGNCRWATRAEQSQNTRRVRLTAESVVAIARRIVDGERRSEIAADFGVSRDAVDRIASGRSWSSVSAIDKLRSQAAEVRR